MEEDIMNPTSAPNVRSKSNDVARIDVGSMSSEQIKLKIEELYEKSDGFK